MSGEGGADQLDRSCAGLVQRNVVVGNGFASPSDNKDIHYTRRLLLPRPNISFCRGSVPPPVSRPLRILPPFSTHSPRRTMNICILSMDAVPEERLRPRALLIARESWLLHTAASILGHVANRRPSRGVAAAKRNDEMDDH